MKLISLSEKFLKLMVVDYKESGKDHFEFEYFKDRYPNETDDSISKALYLLEDENLVSILTADNVAYMTRLNPRGIANCEENSMLKQGYLLIKEIKSLIS